MAMVLDGVTGGLVVCAALLLYVIYLLKQSLRTFSEIRRALFRIADALSFFPSRTSSPLPAFRESDQPPPSETISPPPPLRHNVADPTGSPVPIVSGSPEASSSSTTLGGTITEGAPRLQASETSLGVSQELDEERARQIYSSWSAGDTTHTDPQIQILHLAYGGTRRPAHASYLEPASDFWSEVESPREFIAVWQAPAITAFLFPHPSAFRDSYVGRFFGTGEGLSKDNPPIPLKIQRCADGRWELVR